MTALAPTSYLKLIMEIFSDALHPVYCQVATVDEKGFPKVRTVHVHTVTSDLKYPKKDVLVFNTHIASSKWRELQKKPWLSGCYYDERHLIQFRWESDVTLIDPSSKKYSLFLDQMWLRIRPDVRKAYCLDDDSSNHDLNKRRPNLGVVICQPLRWMIYEINLSDYSKGQSTEHILKNNIWKSQPISLIRGC